MCINVAREKILNVFRTQQVLVYDGKVRARGAFLDAWSWHEIANYTLLVLANQAFAILERQCVKSVS